MSVQVRSRRESAAFLSTYVGAQGEILVDTTNNRVQVHDGATPGGSPAAKLSEVVTNTRTAVADTAYTMLASDRTIAVSSLTAARTITLPAASAFPVGTQLLVFDESGACSTSNAINIARAGADTINGATSAAIATAYGYLAFESNGVARWTIVDQTATTAVSASRTPVADASYTATAGDRLIGYASLTAARTVTLPAASGFPVGTRLLVVDESGGASATSTITLARAGGDTINGGASAVISTAYGYIAVQSNGAAKWTITDQPGASSSAAASRTGVADANYTALASDRLVAFTTLSAARTVTLPAASAFPTGVQVFVVDESGACSATSTITVARAGTDTINGQASAALAAAYGYLALESNGSGKWTVVDQAPTATGGAVAARSSVRQTVQGGPQSGGQPNLLPATSSSLSITAQNVSAGANALTLAAAQGYNASGQNDIVSQLTSNPTWSSLTASTTVYLYINAQNGTTGSTTLQPIYQSGGTIATANGQFTFDVLQMIGYMGNGSAAVATPLVFVGEAVTSSSGVTSTAAYAYNGLYDSGYAPGLSATGTQTNYTHNIGVNGAIGTIFVLCTTAEIGYAAGDVVFPFTSTNSAQSPLSPWSQRNTGGYVTGNGAGLQALNRSTGANTSLTSANWSRRMTFRRPWGGA